MKKAIQIQYNELFEKKCEFASLAGFKYIAVNFTKVIDKNEYEWGKLTETIQKVLERNNLKCIQSHPFYYDLRISSEITDEKSEFAIKQAVIASGKLGADWCVLHPRSSVSTGFCTSAALEDNKRAFSEYLEIAKKHDTGIAAENLPIFHNIVPVMPFYSSNFEDLCILTDSFKDEKMKICWDFGHANLMSFNHADAIKFVGSRIKCTHVHNNFKNEDEHLPPESGNIEWKSVMQALTGTGFDGPLTLETHCRYQDFELLKSFVKYNYACLEFIESLVLRR